MDAEKILNTDKTLNDILVNLFNDLMEIENSCKEIEHYHRDSDKKHQCACAEKICRTRTQRER